MTRSEPNNINFALEGVLDLYIEIKIKLYRRWPYLKTRLIIYEKWLVGTRAKVRYSVIYTKVDLRVRVSNHHFVYQKYKKTRNLIKYDETDWAQDWKFYLVF